MENDPLYRARLRIAKMSLKNSQQRIKKQKEQYDKMSEIEIQEVFDDRVKHYAKYVNLATQFGDESTVTRGKFSPNGDYFVTVGSSGEGVVWDTKDPNSEKFCQTVTRLKGNVKICDACFHPRVGSIPNFAPNIITGSSEGEIFIWSLDSSRQQQKSMKITGHRDRINQTKFHHDGLTFFSASYDHTWSIWDAQKLKQLFNQKGHLKEIHTLDLHIDGSIVFTGDLAGFGMMWDLRTGQGIYELQTTNSILCSSFHPNGYELALGGKNNMIDIFDIRRKKQIKTIPAHTKLISDLHYEQNGDVLVSGSHDNQIKIWHGRDYSSICDGLNHPSKITSVDIHENKITTTMIDSKWSMWIQQNTQLNLVPKRQMQAEE